jgi:hypothetical protein
MPRWFDEKVLIAYWEDNCKKYELPDGRKIISAERNPSFDAYPDILRNELDTGEVVPCEIEWFTSNFKKHEHDINVLLDSGGFLLTFIENTAFDVVQIKIIEEDFIDWISKKSRKLARETVAIIKKNAKGRSDSFVWIIYVSSRGGKDFGIAFENGIWGFPEDDKRKRRGLGEIKDIKEGDFIVFIKQFQSFENNKIVTPRTKDLAKLVGHIQKIVGVRVIDGYYFEDKIRVWDNNIYPHRFNFDKDIVFKGENVLFTPERFGEQLHRQIAYRINANTIEHIDASMFLKIMGLCAKK